MKAGSMVKLLPAIRSAFVLTLPLLATTIKWKPGLYFLGLGINIILSIDTGTSFSNSRPPEATNKSYERIGLKTLVTTSKYNRSIRLLLGLLHVYAAWSYATSFHFVGEGGKFRDDNELGERSASSMIVEWAGTSLLLTVSSSLLALFSNGFLMAHTNVYFSTRSYR